MEYIKELYLVTFKNGDSIEYTGYPKHWAFSVVTTHNEINKCYRIHAEIRLDNNLNEYYVYQKDNNKFINSTSCDGIYRINVVNYITLNQFENIIKEIPLPNISKGERCQIWTMKGIRLLQNRNIIVKETFNELYGLLHNNYKTFNFN